MADPRRSVVWAPSARLHLSQAISYLAKESPQAARKLLAAVVEKATSLESLSERGSIISEVRDPVFRQFLVRPYRLIYRVAGREVHIVAFVHGAREFTQWRREMDKGAG